MAEGMLPPLVLELRAKAGELISEVKTAQAEVTAAAEKTEVSAAKIEEAWAGAGASMKAQVLSAQGTLEAANARVAGLRQEQAAASKAVTDAETALAGAIEKEGATSAAAADAEKVLTDAKLKLEAASGKVAAAEKTEEAAKQRMIATNEKLVGTTAEQSSGMQKFGKAAAIGIAGAAVAVGVESLKMAGDFQAQVTRLHTAAGESEANLKSVGDGILSIARSTGTSTEQLTSGMYMVESAGFHGADGLKVLTAASQGAKNEGADLEGVGNALTTVMDDLGAKSGQAANLMSQMVATVGQGKMKMDDLAGSIHTVLPNAAALGVKFPQVAGALATMTAEGVSAEQAAQNLNHTIVKLAAPTTAMSNAMSAYGVNADDLKNNLGKNGLTGTFDILSKAITDRMGPAGTAMMDTFKKNKTAIADVQTMMQNLPASVQDMAQGFLNGSTSAKDFTKAGKELGAAGSEQVKQFIASSQAAYGFNDALSKGKSPAQTFNQAMYSMLGDQTGLQVALHLTGDHMQTFKDNVATIGKASADANGNVKDWSVTQDTFNNRMARLKETVQTAAIAIGQHLLPPVSAFVGFLAGHTGVMIAFAAVIGTVLVAAAAAWAYGVAKTVASNVKELAKDAAEGAKWVATKVAQLAKAVASMVAWVAKTAAQLAISAAKWTAYSVKWAAQQAAAMAKWLAQQALAVASWVATQAVGFAQAAAAGAVWIAEHIAMAAEAVVQYGIMAAAATAAFIAENAATLGIGLAIAAVIAAVVWLATHWSEAWKAITDAAKWAYDNVIKPVAGWIYDNAIAPIGKAIGWLSGIWSAEWKVVTQAASWAYNNVIKPVAEWIYNNAIQPIVKGIQGLGGIWSAIWDGIKGAVSSVWNFIKPIFDAIGGAISKVTGGISAVTGVAGKIGNLLGFDNGGFIPGPAGAPKLVVAHGGEYVLSRDMLAGRQQVDDSILSGAKSANGYVPAAGAASTPDVSQLALAGGASSSSTASGGGGGQTVIVNAYTQASPAAIASAAGWQLRKMA